MSSLFQTQNPRDRKAMTDHQVGIGFKTLESKIEPSKFEVLIGFIKRFIWGAAFHLVTRRVLLGLYKCRFYRKKIAVRVLLARKERIIFEPEYRFLWEEKEKVFLS